MALGFAFVIEGLFYAIFAKRLPDYLATLIETPPAAIRRLGFMVAGAGLLWMIWVRYTKF